MPRADLNTLSSADRANLVNLILSYLNDAVVASHTTIIHRDIHIFTGHRTYIEGLEAFLASSGGGQFVPLPKWDPAKPIPAEFNVVKPRDNGTQRVPLVNLNPNLPKPSQFAIPAVWNFPNGDNLGNAVNFWHGSVHEAVGGTMVDFNQASAAPIFWCWHAYVDEIYSDWEQRNLADGRPIWIGNFSRSDRAEILYYYPRDTDWWLGSNPAGQFQWRSAGNTRGFGQVWDGRPFWTGNFSRADRAEMLFYFPNDGNWWLGSHDGNQLSWSLAGNTLGFGQVWDGRPFWIGDFNGNGRADVLFYFPNDGNWWLGSHPGPGGQFQWSLAGNTLGFGQVWDGRPFWTGNFSRADRAEMLFYFPNDGNWWLGSHDGNQLSWSLAGNTLGFGQVWDGRPFWIGDFNGNGRADVLFYFPGDGNWQLGSHPGPGGQLQWTFAGNRCNPRV